MRVVVHHSIKNMFRSTLFVLSTISFKGLTGFLSKLTHYYYGGCADVIPLLHEGHEGVSWIVQKWLYCHVIHFTRMIYFWMDVQRAPPKRYNNNIHISLKLNNKTWLKFELEASLWVIGCFLAISNEWYVVYFIQTDFKMFSFWIFMIASLKWWECECGTVAVWQSAQDFPLCSISLKPPHLHFQHFNFWLHSITVKVHLTHTFCKHRNTPPFHI